MEDSHRSKKRRLDQWTPDEFAEIAHQRLKSPTTKKRRLRGGYRPNYGLDVTHPHQTDQYRPTYSNDDNKPRRFDHYSPRSQIRSQRSEDARSYEAQNEPTERRFTSRPPAQKQQFQPNNHSTKARKSNPSTRIRSIQKQLAHPSAATMPANVLAEKERELQFLLDSREETQEVVQKGPKRGAKEKKMLQKYHMVRFIERKKAERNLKQARKQLQELADGKEETVSIKANDDEIRHFQCDLLYCLFAPLGEKYISMFVGDGQTQKPEARQSKDKEKDSTSKSRLNENSRIDRVGQQAGWEAFRPPHWYVVEAILREAQSKQIKDAEDLVQVPPDNDSSTSVTLSLDQLHQLETLRDGKGKSSSSGSTSLTPFNTGLAVRSKGPVAGKKRKKPSWQEETEEPTDPMEADNDKSEDGGMRLNASGNQGEVSQSDDEFFE